MIDAMNLGFSEMLFIFLFALIIFGPKKLPEIGRQFGGKHHTTVLHSVEKIEASRKADKDLNRLLNKLTEQLGG